MTVDTYKYYIEAIFKLNKPIDTRQFLLTQFVIYYPYGFRHILYSRDGQLASIFNLAHPGSPTFPNYITQF